MSSPRWWLWLTLDDERGICLVRGLDAMRATRLVCGPQARYSSAGRGWVIPIAYADDVLAMAETYRTFCVVSRRERKAAAS
jgi:hypothetical protein